MSLQLRPLTDADDLTGLTALIHAAYAPHAARGLRYWGSHQSVEDTRKRLGYGIGLIAEEDGDYVGTATIRPPQPASPIPLYRQPDVWTLLQFCVSPRCKGLGYGKALHTYAARMATAQGASTLALDTAQPATGLIALYEAWGYTIVDACDWRPHTNYPSVVMALPLRETTAVAT